MFEGAGGRRRSASRRPMVGGGGPPARFPRAGRAGPAAYVSPTMRERMIRSQGPQDGMSPELRLRASANGYANKRLGQFDKIGSQVGGDFADQLGSTDRSDPAAAYRALSALFSQFSQSQGMADPRALLRMLLGHAQGPPQGFGRDILGLG